VDFDRLVAKHKNAVYRQLFRMCGNHDDAEDVLTQAMVDAFRSLNSLRDEQAFRAWLVQIGRRACGRLKQRESKRPVVGLSELLDKGIEPAAGIAVDQQAEERELKQCIASVLGDLPPKYREVYVLRDIDGLEGQAVADRLGISLASQKSRLHRARSLVRTMLDERLECQP